MEDYPKTLSEFEFQFGTTKACREYLFRLRWPDGFRCPRCRAAKAWAVTEVLFECAECHYQSSVTAGTIFDRSRIPLTVWFRVIWWITSQKTGASALGLKRILGFGSYETAWTCLHKLRRAMVRSGRDRLAGIIEVDETYIGGEKPGKRGRGAAGKALVIIAAQRDGKRIGRIRLCQVQDASGPNLMRAIQKAIEPGNVIITDGWQGYNGVKALGYTHEIVREDADVGDSLLPLCHRVAALLKRWLAGTHQGAVSHEHLDYYLDEYTFRFNRRTSQYRGKLFYRLLEQAVATAPSTYATIIQHARGPKSANHHI